MFTYKYSIEVGEIDNDDIIYTALNKLTKKYRANKYDMLKFNCNHFTHEFLVLLIGKGLPHYLNRAAYIGSFFHCIVPRKFLIVTPDTKYYDVVKSSSTNDIKSTTAGSMSAFDDCSSTARGNYEDDLDDSDDEGEEGEIYEV